MTILSKEMTTMATWLLSRTSSDKPNVIGANSPIKPMHVHHSFRICPTVHWKYYLDIDVKLKHVLWLYNFPLSLKRRRAKSKVLTLDFSQGYRCFRLLLLFLFAISGLITSVLLVNPSTNSTLVCPPNFPCLSP